MPLQRSLCEGLRQYPAPPVLIILRSDNHKAHPASYVAIASTRKVIEGVIYEIDLGRGPVNVEPGAKDILLRA